VTALSREEKFVFKGYEAGAVDYLYKPIEPIVLKSKVRVFCDLYHHKRTIEAQLAEITEKNRLLEERMREITRLRGLLPVCCNCRKVRDDKGYWSDLEEYFIKNTELSFSHGLCEDCLHELYPEYEQALKRNMERDISTKAR
jgi:hypothetical protein